MSIVSAWRTFVAAVIVGGCLWEPSPFAQTPAQSSPSHVVIPFLANATKSTDLDFEGGECDVDASGDRMTCTFQQVFLTTSPVAPDTCLITTHSYERVFRRESATRWTNAEGPEGICGVMDVTTLQDDGGVRWTMELHKTVTKKDAAPACQTTDPESELFSWQNIRRSLPCKFVQPAGL